MKTIKRIQFERITTTDYFNDYLRIKSDSQAVAWSGFDTPPDSLYLKSYFENLIISDRKVYFLIIDETPVGYCQFSINEEGICELDGYSVLSEYGGHGYGYLMIIMLLFILESENQQGIIAWVSENNHSSLRCLEKSGFSILSNHEKYVELKAFHRKDRFIAMYRPISCKIRK